MSTSTIRADGFSVTTRFEVAPITLYEAWTVERHVEQWLATDAEIDARVNGKYIFRWPSPDGELSARGEYIDLIPEKKIIQTWESWGPQGRYTGADATILVELKELGNGVTAMTQTEWGPAYKDRSHIDMSISGTIEAHNELAQYIDSYKQ